MAYQPTQRVYTEHSTGQRFRMYHNGNTDQNYLLNETTGEEVRSFYCSVSTPLSVKFKDGTIESLQVGEFVRIKPGNPPTHRKFCIDTRFRKL